MDAFKEGKYFRYVEKAPIWFTISLVAIIAGVVFMFMRDSATGSPFNLSIHYTGGEKLILRFAEQLDLDGQAVKEVVETYATSEPIVQVYADDPYVVSIKLGVAASGETEDLLSRNRQQVLMDMKEELGNKFGGFSSDETSPNPETLEQAHVGPTVGGELIRNAILALVFGCVLIMLYIWMRFSRWQMSLAAIAALIHDVLITLGVTAALGLEVSDSFIAVILTIIGYSINDTIIIFDRIRENVRKYGDDVPLAQVSNISLNQTLVRSLNTVFTVIIMVVALMILGGHNLRDFLIAMLVGMISGGYSSIFIATPVMLWLTGGKLTVATEPAVNESILPQPSVSESDTPMESETLPAKVKADKDEKKKATKKQRRR